MRKTALLTLFVLLHVAYSATPPPTSNGYNCSADRSIYPCQAYAFYRAGANPSLMDLPSVGDLFGVTRLSVARASSLVANSTILANQPLLVPLTCGCHSNLSYYPVSYSIAAGDTYYVVSSFKFGNLTSYPVVEVVNPTLVPTNLSIGVDVIFPIFCQCPTRANVTIITYSFQPGDNFSSVAAELGSDVQSLVSLNGREESVQPFTTILVPVSKLPPPVVLNSSQALPPTTNSTLMPISIHKEENKGAVVGLAIAVGIMAILLVALLVGMARLLRRARRRWEEELGVGKSYGEANKYGKSASDDKLMNDISEWLDKYRVYRIEELMEATDDFGASSLIQGSVYKGTMDGEVYAIKKMKWNACDELKILQKVLLSISSITN